MGKRGYKIANHFNGEGLFVLNETFYWSILQAVLDDQAEGLVNIKERSCHEMAFTRFIVLITSVLGGFCQPGAAERVISLTLLDLLPLLLYPPEKDSFAFTQPTDKEMTRFIHPVVENAAFVLIINRMRSEPTRNNGLSPLPSNVLLAPSCSDFTGNKGKYRTQSGYRRYLVDQYFLAVAAIANVPVVPSLRTFADVSRDLLPQIYPSDIASALTGLIKFKPLPSEQLGEMNLLNGLRSFSNKDPNSNGKSSL